MRVEDSSLDALTHLFNNREIDRTRAAALNFVEIDEPVIILDCPPGANGIGATQLLIDGIHRIFERHRRGYSFFEAYLLPLQLACRADLSEGRFAPWGKFDVVPGRGLVRRKDK
jgi:hypothetical protein